MRMQTDDLNDILKIKKYRHRNWVTFGTKQ